MRVVVIGGSGHVGTFLVPRLIVAEHEVVSISRGKREPYQFHPAWQSVEQVTLDREAERTWDHIAHSPNGSIAKAGRLLDYQPRYSSLRAVRESLEWLVEQDEVEAEWTSQSSR